MVAMIAGGHSVSAVCEALGVSRSGYYDRATREPSSRCAEDAELADIIEEIYRDNRCVYGCPRIDLALRLQGRCHGKLRIARLMKGRGLKGRSRGRFKPFLTHSEHQYGYSRNLLGKMDFPKLAHQVWVSDTTYIKTNQGWIYLAVTMDLHSRYVVGWKVSPINDSELTACALERAAKDHSVVGLLHHSDRGSTYASDRFMVSLKEIQAVSSMSRKGNCYDNAEMESFFGSLKAECVQGISYRDLEQANQSLFSYIEGFYNTRRLHTSIGMTPLQKLQQSIDEQARSSVIDAAQNGDARRSPNP
jgi:putative transposase